MKWLAPDLTTAASNKAAVDLATAAKKLQAAGVPWEQALRQASSAFQGQLVTTEEGFRKTKVTTYVPRPDGVPENFRVSSEPITPGLLAKVRAAANDPKLDPSRVKVWVNPNNPQDLKVDVQ